MMPLWKFAEVELLVRRVRVLVRQADAEQHRRQPELLLERRHHRNRSALAREDRRPAEALLDRAAGGLHERVVVRRHPRLAAVHARDLQLDGLRRDLLARSASNSSAILFGILVRHEAHADLRHRDGRQHGLRAFAGEAGQQAVDLEASAAPRCARAWCSRSRRTASGCRSPSCTSSR